jgi:hypothetical protein
MTYKGTFRKGVVVLDEPAQLPDGSKVEVSLVQGEQPSRDAAEGPSVFEQLKDLAGTVEGLPTDVAENHDHYLYGTKKKK